MFDWLIYAYYCFQYLVTSYFLAKEFVWWGDRTEGVTFSFKMSRDILQAAFKKS